jgi:hypothetical protein
MFLYLDGKKFLITNNLHSALLALRDFSASRYLWIDAICINQTDVGEKNREVPRMMQIYQAADIVVVWLGEASEVSSLAFNHLQLLSKINFMMSIQPSSLQDGPFDTSPC